MNMLWGLFLFPSLHTGTGNLFINDHSFSETILVIPKSVSQEYLLISHSDSFVCHNQKSHNSCVYIARDRRKAEQ